MRPLLCTLGLISVLLTMPAVGQEKLRLVADSWPPFTDSSMPGGGLATSLVTTALARAGYASGYRGSALGAGVEGRGRGAI